MLTFADLLWASFSPIASLWAPRSPFWLASAFTPSHSPLLTRLRPTHSPFLRASGLTPSRFPSLARPGPHALTLASAGLAPLALTFAGPFQIPRCRAFAGQLRASRRRVCLGWLASGLTPSPARRGLHNCHCWLAPHALALTFVGAFQPYALTLALLARFGPLSLASTASLCASCSPSLARFGLNARLPLLARVASGLSPLLTRLGPRAVALIVADSLRASRHRARFCWLAVAFMLAWLACFPRPRPHLDCLASALRAHTHLAGSFRASRTLYRLALCLVLAFAAGSP